MLIAILTALFSLPFEIVYWIKWVIAYISIQSYISSNKKRFDSYDLGANDPVKLGFLIPQIETDLESPQSETHLQEAADEVFFYGVNSKSECLLVRITRGANQEAEAWIYLKLANGKTYHLAEHVNYQQPYEGECLTFSCGNLQMHYLAPMRRWRIHYCGSLIEKTENKESPDRNAFVKFVFLWSTSSDVYDVSLSNNPSKYASCIANSEWKYSFKPPIQEFSETMNMYYQIGNTRGTVSIDDEAEYEINLFGEKFRNLGNSARMAGCNFEILLGYVPQNGFGLHLSIASVPKVFRNLPFGFVIQPNGSLNNVNEIDITVKPISTSKAGRHFEAKCNTGEVYELQGTISADPVVLYSGQGWNGFVEISFVSFTVNKKTGYGLIMTGEIYNDPPKTSKPTENVLFPKTVPLTVKFTDEISQFGDISGGKGSSLGKLTKLSRTDKTFTVPKGIVVTTSAYQTFITKDMLNSIKILENITYGKTRGDVKETCEIVATNILNTALPNKICQSIIDDLKRVFGDEFRNKKYAVRSSATGEDTDVMSAAGQMDTFLGIEGLQEIFVALKKCWASQFGHIAVEYKRQNGQPINSPMAVVIQEMIASEVSGVLFTCDPVNNNPNIITITANFGLGETVVSGSVEPDTIMLQRTADDGLEIKSTVIGAKHQKMVMDESGGTVTQDLPEENKNFACIDSEMCIKLASLGINVEKFYKSSRDIEWGISNNKIYLLQSRPVTSGGALTDFEIKHEFDCVVRSENEYYTIANIGEVMPGASSPLGMIIAGKSFSIGLAHDAFKKGEIDLFCTSMYFESGVQTCYYQGVFPVPELVCRHGHDTMFSKGFIISIFGRLLEEPEVYEIAKEKFKQFPPSTIMKDFRFIKNLFFYNRNIEKFKKKYDFYNVPALDCKTAEEAFDALMQNCFASFDAAAVHWGTSEVSSHWNVLLFLILLKAKGRFDSDVYSDFGRILSSSSNVESADIPSSLQKLANHISKDLGSEKFKAMSVEEAVNWLSTSDSASGQRYRQFIKRHGHRCLKEFDILSKTWSEDQGSLIKLLKTLTGSTKEVVEKSDDGYSKLFNELRVPLSFLNRVLLRLAIPNCRKGVSSRETTKSIMIKGIDNWRKGFRHLAKLMVAEGRIPEEELVYFMTLDELKTLLKTRYPKIISRASHRKKMFPTLDQYKFPEIMKGFPKPINEEDDSTDATDYTADLTMQGIPVSQGVVKGYARVATSLEEAEQLKIGEILIAYSTDIGWSPYFPIIAGVVTELGGLISHGAVVSREYGLPCVVGLRGATKQFKTGDYVLLDGKKGILQRLPKPADQS